MYGLSFHALIIKKIAHFAYIMPGYFNTTPKLVEIRKKKYGFKITCPESRVLRIKLILTDKRDVAGSIKILCSYLYRIYR